MQEFTIYFLTLAAGCMVAMSITTGRLFSIKTVFLLMWFYYGFCVGLDMLMGIPIPFIPGELNLNDRLSQSLIIRVMSHYFVCAAGFVVVYWLFQNRRDDPGDKSYSFLTLSIPVLVLAHIVLATFYVSEFFGIDRGTRLLLGKASVQVLVFGLMLPSLIVLDVVTAINSGGIRGKVALVLSTGLGLLSGQRIYILISALVYIFRYRESIKPRSLVLGTVAVGFSFFIFKPAYAVLMSWWLGGSFDLALIWERSATSLSSLEGLASFSIVANFLNADCPYWLGTSYYEIPMLLTRPRFLGGSDVHTLAELYVLNYHVDMANSGRALAFSAIAEAWLNFGAWGALILGAIWGRLASYFDQRPRGIIFYLMLILTVRLFRSDFATLYKTWIVVWGVILVGVLCLLYLYTFLRLAKDCHRSVTPAPDGNSDVGGRLCAES